ncbi:cupin domain-containing protein [Candidatus Woesearchaeota archaeon]|nr:cupin domain-containing protein [Candidatus Woesearchaeota archaeon]
MKTGNLSDLSWSKRFTYIKSIPFTENNLRCKGAKFQVVKFLPYTSIKAHHHLATTEIFYVRSGRGILKINNQEFRCQKDDFFLCEPNDIHEFVNDTNEEFIILIFKTNEQEGDIYWN